MDKQIIKDFLKYDSAVHDAVGYRASFKLHRELNKFYDSMKKFSEELKNYGYTLEISIDAINGGSNKQKLLLKLCPWGKEYDFLTASWDENYEHGKLYYVINPNFKENFLEVENGKEIDMYLPALSFVFLQIYEQRDIIMSKFKVQAYNDIKGKTQEKRELNRCYESIKNKETFDNINLEEMIDELNKEHEKLRKNIGEYPMMYLQNELQDFFNHFKKMGEDIEGIGSTIKVEIPILTIDNKFETYTLEYRYFENRDYKTLIGYSESDIYKGNTICDVFDPSFSREKFTEKEQEEEKFEKRVYLSVSDHVFLQLYENRALIYEKFDGAVYEYIKRHKDFNTKLYDIYKET